MSKQAAILAFAGAVLVVGIGAYFLFMQSDEGETLPRYTIDFQIPERAVFAIGESFSVTAVVTTVTPKLEEYQGVWEPTEPYQRPWRLEGEYVVDGPAVIVSGERVIVGRPEVETPPDETERGITSEVATFACEEEGAAHIIFSYSVQQESRGLFADPSRDVLSVECVLSTDLPPDEFGGSLESGGARPKVTAPTVNPGIRIKGLEGLKQ
ncbi:hypothetical protein COU20_01495 [Candidatus Kaiserbacteria bacterium CG10_big_fil_rev_8_21_14_0_10_59_10]|uniref:Uncharacterized protein n=1 Tax=Candidatus Kaiserbacteria bacterium CG10_big_fil_rev_8_21_14_0_10_59_10 TaxID=1974612 RepID=A0A2H0U896_9BACT|nr:MAG: hypothetical protein COU20_01495 [Candidatus Kaiserbacteria bacterium CG10_big_fil_rev_8_21_14_0_10_59_10]